MGLAGGAAGATYDRQGVAVNLLRRRDGFRYPRRMHATKRMTNWIRQTIVIRNVIKEVIKRNAWKKNDWLDTEYYSCMECYKEIIRENA